MNRTQWLNNNRWLRAAVGCAALAAHADVGGAQNGPGPERQGFRDVTGDIWSIWTSPVRARGHDLVVAAGLAGAVAVTTRLDSAVYRWMTGHDHSAVMSVLTPTRERSRLPAYQFGSGQYLIPAASLVYVAGRLSHSVALRDAGLGCVAGHLSTLGVREAAFHLVSRARPRVTLDPFDLSMPGSADWLRQSFFSGHIANTMACASLLTHRFQWRGAAIIPYAASTAIGLGRLADGAHWTSDVVTGGIVGFMIGKALAERERARLTRAPAIAAPSVRRGSLQVPVFAYRIVF
jgi:membrane-associated phospholipid phosphatase